MYTYIFAFVSLSFGILGPHKSNKSPVAIAHMIGRKSRRRVESSGTVANHCPRRHPPKTHLTHPSIPKTHSALRTGTLLIIIITPAHAACHPLGKVTVFVMITNQEFPASALISSRHHNLRLSASVPDLVGSPLEISMDNVLTIEELRQHMGSCFTCGVSWTDDHVSLDCSECGGYSLERPCPLCDGQCGVQWKRDFAMVS